MDSHATEPRKLSDEATSSHIGRLLQKNKISQNEFRAGQDWRELYLTYLVAIGAPGWESDKPLSDAKCEQVVGDVRRYCERITCLKGRRALHALNSITVYEDPEELGDFEFTTAAARAALTYLAEVGVPKC